MSEKVSRYTLGIIKDRGKVLLILKNRPTWQAGKWNFPGGKFEGNESPEECVSREIKEECCIDIKPASWNRFALMVGPEWEVQVLTADLEYADYEGVVEQGEDQAVEWFDFWMPPPNIVSNLYWLIPAAFDENIKDAKISFRD